MVAEPLLVLFCGGMGGSSVEELLAAALRESALDTLEEALATGAFGGAVVVADRRSAAAFEGRLPAGARIDVDEDRAFHFGERLRDVVRRYDIERPVSLGWGMPLLKGDELAAVAHSLSTSDRIVISNNYFSADLAGFTPGRAVLDLDLPNNDRVLAQRLVQEARFVSEPLPRTVANQFDIDTPGDLAIVAQAGGGGPRLTKWLEAHTVSSENLAKAAWSFTDNQAVVLVCGRAGADILQYLQTETASQTRLYSEERGLQAMGRDLSGEARTLAGFHLQAVGPSRFFEDLAEMTNAAFIDTRPIFGHLGLRPSRRDRFLSDLLQPEEIADPWVREFTSAARAAPIPVVLGGQTLVTSGLQLLSEAAWKEHDKLEAEWKARGRARQKN